jgi:hypothetical protein
MNKLRNYPTPVVGQRRLPPVRVKLLRADAYEEQTCPPDDGGKDWWIRLNNALGTVSSGTCRVIGAYFN